MSDIFENRSPFDPSSVFEHPDSSNPFLSFSALADLDLQHSNSAHRQWLPSRASKMNDFAAHPAGEQDFADCYLLDSPESSYGGISPQSYVSGEISYPGLPFPPTDYSTQTGETSGTSYADNSSTNRPSSGRFVERNIFSSGGYSNSSLASKASNESFASSTSGISEYLLTPRHSVSSQPYAWDDLATISGSTNFACPLDWEPKSSDQFDDSITGNKRLSFSTLIGQAGHAESIMPLLDDEQDYVQTEVAAKSADEDSLGTGRNPSSAPPFVGRDLSFAFNRQQQSLDESIAIPVQSPKDASLLPPACIVGNVPGWQHSSPTYPSLLDFEDASSQGDMQFFRTEPVLNSSNIGYSATAGPAHMSRSFLTVPRATSMQKSRSADGGSRRSSMRAKDLFAFHPVDHTSSSSTALFIPSSEFNLALASPANSQPGLSARRSVTQLSVQIPYSERALYAPSMGKSYSHSGAMAQSVAVHSAPLEPTAYGLNDCSELSPYSMQPVPFSAPPYPLYAYNYASMPLAPPVPTRRMSIGSASVMQPAPGNINIAPPLSATPSKPTFSTASAQSENIEPGTTPIPATCRRAPPQPILTCKPLAIPELGADTVRAVAPLPSKRRTSENKARKVSAGKKKAAMQPEAHKCSFINFTADDAAVIQAGVAPSGSKGKRKAEEPSEQSNKRARSCASA